LQVDEVFPVRLGKPLRVGVRDPLASRSGWVAYRCP
jgi:hypothetical protein